MTGVPWQWMIGVPRPNTLIGIFRLVRVEDETGVSGAGIVAYGTLYPNGKVTLAWVTADKPQSVVVYDSFADMFDIHVAPHKWKTGVEWLHIIEREAGANS